MNRWFLRFLSLSVIGLTLVACTDYSQSGTGNNICANSSSCSGGASNASRPSDTEGSSASPSSKAYGNLYNEETYNHRGTDVFKDPMGDAVVSGAVSIPFGTHVMVKCWAPNQSSMGSINVFYLVETRPWTGEYAPANTFLNADSSGSLDPQVPKCPTA
jgi:hypothetical protein